MTDDSLAIIDLNLSMEKLTKMLDNHQKLDEILLKPVKKLTGEHLIAVIFTGLCIWSF